MIGATHLRRLPALGEDNRTQGPYRHRSKGRYHGRATRSNIAVRAGAERLVACGYAPHG